MKRRLLAFMLAGALVCMSSVTAIADETTEEKAEDTATEETAEEKAEVEMVDVAAIDLSLHSETSGDFTSIYDFENPFKGEDTMDGVIIEFYAEPTWEVHELGAIFAIVGTEDYDGRLYFSPGSYLGFNSANFGGYYDANLYNYTLVTDYIKSGALMRIELLPDGFAVYANDELCYDQTILDDPLQGSGDYTSTSNFKKVLKWLKGAETLSFGANSWWNAVGGNEANVLLSKVSFRLMDGTVLFDQLQADKNLIESLGGEVITELEDNTSSGIQIKDMEVDVFNIDEVDYKGTNVLPIMIVIVVVVSVVAGAVVATATKKRVYNEV